MFAYYDQYPRLYAYGAAGLRGNCATTCLGRHSKRAVSAFSSRESVSEIYKAMFLAIPDINHLLCAA